MTNQAFNPAQQITAKLFYNLVAQLEGEQRIGAVRALSALIPATEDGFIAMNDGETRQDFFVQCFDILVAVALSLKMLEDDGLVPDIPEITPKKMVKRLQEADLALQRIEDLLTRSPRGSPMEH